MWLSARRISPNTNSVVAPRRVDLGAIVVLGGILAQRSPQEACRPGSNPVGETVAMAFLLGGGMAAGWGLVLASISW